MGLFTVKKVGVEAVLPGCVNENQLKDSSGILGQNFFLVNSAKIEKILKQKFFCIKSLNISKHFPDKVILQTSGRQPFAVLVDLKDKPVSPASLIENIATPSAGQLGNLYTIDDEGVVFDKNKDALNTPRIYIYGLTIAQGNNWTGGLNALKILDKAKTFGVDIGESWMDEGYFVINSKPKPKIIFNLGGNIDIQLASLQLILAEAKINLKELEFIDLRFDKPIVRFTPKKNG